MGQCTGIPQAQTEAAENDACASQRSCATRFPSQVLQFVVLFICPGKSLHSTAIRNAAGVLLAPPPPPNLAGCFDNSIRTLQPEHVEDRVMGASEDAVQPCAGASTGPPKNCNILAGSQHGQDT